MTFEEWKGDIELDNRELRIARAAWNAALEEAAEVCPKHVAHWQLEPCVAAIRELKAK